MATTFESLLAEHGYKVRQTTRILPPRQKTSGPRTGNHLQALAREVGDLWYYNALPLTKFLYSKIEDRYKQILAESDLAPSKKTAAIRRRDALMNEVKTILNEHRNQIFEAVLPMYTVTKRAKALPDGEALPEADQHVHDYFVRNVFYMLVKTYDAYVTEFVAEDEADAARKTIARLGQVHSEKLGQELRNYEFGFRPVKHQAR